MTPSYTTHMTKRRWDGTEPPSVVDDPKLDDDKHHIFNFFLALSVFTRAHGIVEVFTIATLRP